MQACQRNMETVMAASCLPDSERLQHHASLLLQAQARAVMTLSEVEPRVQEQGKQYEGAKGSLQGAIAAVVSEMLEKDVYTHEGIAASFTVTVSAAHNSATSCGSASCLLTPSAESSWELWYTARQVASSR